MNKMSKEEKKQWNDLYQYVRKEILLYDENKAIPQNIILRLKGLQQGKLMANNNIDNNANYPFEIILLTFKLYKQTIMSAMQGKDFKDEMTKFIYISRIIENNINDVYDRIKNAKELKEKTEKIDTANVYNEGAEYKRKTQENKVTNKFKDMW